MLFSIIVKCLSPKVNSDVDLAEYWISCITDSVKTILSKKDEELLEDSLNEFYQQPNSISFDVVQIEKDRLASEIMQLTHVATLTQNGLDAFLVASREIRCFFTITNLFLEFSCSSK